MSVSPCGVEQHSGDRLTDRNPITGEAVIEPAQADEQV
jgi:hypothetical protein